VAQLAQIVVFGASGDLTARKLIPALFFNYRAGAFKGPVQVIGAARRDKTDDAWRAELAQWLPQEDRDEFRAFAQRVFYQRADSLKLEELQGLNARLDALAGDEAGTCGRLFYLALKPSLFGATVAGLCQADMLQCPPKSEVGWRRVVVEKPFGRDLESARKLNIELLSYVREDQLFRIDHYLGKETVQNILAFRFQNSIFEPLWNRNHVESVEISVCEEVSIGGGRGGYYDGAGALRDMVQNHVLQILALTTMEPPNSMDADDVRSEKRQLLAALDHLTPERVKTHVVRAQYEGYRGEEGVDSDSTTETYVAVRASIHNWRWNGVPFLLRTGKSLHKRYTEVVLRFRAPPVDLLNGPVVSDSCMLRPNALHLLIQPHEGIRLGFLVKQPGKGTVMRPASLGFDYDDLENADIPPAYQRLLLDAIEGNATLFIRGDEVEAAWRFVDSIRAGWSGHNPPVHLYRRGSQGPIAAQELFRDCEGMWGDGEDRS